jgi:hypothetical protein
MATTAIQIIGRALRLINVIDANEAIEANIAQDTLETLNGMLAEWHEAQIGLPDYSFATLTDTLATDAADREAIAYQLAIRVAPEYGRSLSQEAAVIAEASMARLRLRYFQPGKSDLSELPRICRQFNIVTGDN